MVPGRKLPAAIPSLPKKQKNTKKTHQDYKGHPGSYSIITAEMSAFDDKHFELELKNFRMNLTSYSQLRESWEELTITRLSFPLTVVAVDQVCVHT